MIAGTLFLGKPQEGMQFKIAFQFKIKAVHTDPLSRCIVDKTDNEARGQRMKYGLYSIRAGISTQKDRGLIALQDERLAARGIFLTGSIKTLDSGA